MTLELAIGLESVSKSFLTNAHRFYNQLEEFDFKDYLTKEGEAKWASKIAKRCNNLKKIRNLQVHKDSFEGDVINFQFISQMTSILSVGVDISHFSSVLMPILGDMANLNHIEIIVGYLNLGNRSIDPKKFRKLNVTSLKCNYPIFVDFCNPERLTSLDMTVKFESMDSIILTLKRYRNLHELSIDLDLHEINEAINKLIEFVLPSTIRNFSLGVVLNEYNKEDFRKLAQNHKFIHRLKLDDSSTNERGETFVSSVLKLSELKSLTFENVLCPADVFLSSFANLNHFTKVSSFSFCPFQFESWFEVKSIFERFGINKTGFKCGI